MAKYTVTHSCGHDEIHNLTGPHKNREWWLENVGPVRLCSDCYHEEKQNQYADQSARSAEAAQVAGLPALTGSEKQIAWAETLRSAFLASALQYDLAAALRDLKTFVAIKGDWEWETEKNFEFDESAIQEIKDALVLLQDEPRAWTESRKWIDGRNHSGRQYVATQLEARLETLCPTVAGLFAEREAA